LQSLHYTFPSFISTKNNSISQSPKFLSLHLHSLMSTHQSAITESLAVSTAESHKAWHILALLFAVGRPTPPAHLASLCSLFPASTLTVHSLCSLPYSPITLTTVGLVTVSYTSIFAFADLLSNSNLIHVFVPRNFPSSDFIRLCLMKRRRIVIDDEDGDEEEQDLVPMSKRMRTVYTQAHYYISADVSSCPVNPKLSKMSVSQPCLLLEASAGQLSFKCEDTYHLEGKMHMNVYLPRTVHGESMAIEADSESSLSGRVNKDASFCLDDVTHGIVSIPVRDVNDSYKAKGVRVIENEGTIESRKLGQLIDLNMPPVTEIDDITGDEKMPLLDIKQTTTHLDTMAIFSANGHPFGEKHLLKPSAKTIRRNPVAPKLPVISKPLGNSKNVKSAKEKQSRRDKILINKQENFKKNHNDMLIKEKRRNSNSISSEVQPKPKVLPNFDSYIVEEEEGSGGYGTVYRARRKSDGATVAIKCPHENAHRHHANNELRMLERFGGKNFVIRYVGCFKNENSDCLVLEHVQHDRPEILKREIDIFQLQWYGYCMFRALASLHKQGIFHRDVKPGNFLFSRKANKGYLIDFNLAMDLHQKYGTPTNSKVQYGVCSDNVALSNPKFVPATTIRKLASAKPLGVVNQGATKCSKSKLEHKNLKKKAVGQAKAYNDMDDWNKINSQGADGSGITSAKDVTSTRTPSAERLREPLPCQGRKELIHLLQKARHASNHEALRIPAPMKKRIAAPPVKLDKELLSLTPMPLHTTGITGAGAGLIKNKGDGKHKREGPCAGTKGFRAPEVLFRSPHQGQKADIWSAGVTLLYLMIGRTPFFGDPEQNIKDIAKLRGNEDLWEVAKLHNRESSFPQELYDTQFLPSVNLRDWCNENTKRRDFLDKIPSSLFDLVDKCLTVNPRLRISAEEALKHEFFTLCHEGLRKQRLLRQGLSLDSAAGQASHVISISRTVKIS
ncbi:Pkinase domain-containing protein, partial [Cephalotus follicularis]